MDINTRDEVEQGVAEAGDERRVAPPVHQLTEEQAAAGPLAELAGTITVICGRADSEVIEALDGSLESGDVSGFATWMNEEFEAYARSETSDGSDVTAELTYEGETVAELTLGADDALGATIEPFDGGDLDEMAFKISESGGDVDLKYHVLVVPPTRGTAE